MAEWIHNTQSADWVFAACKIFVLRKSRISESRRRWTDSSDWVDDRGIWTCLFGISVWVRNHTSSLNDFQLSRLIIQRIYAVFSISIPLFSDLLKWKSFKSVSSSILWFCPKTWFVRNDDFARNYNFVGFRVYFKRSHVRVRASLLLGFTQHQFW